MVIEWLFDGPVDLLLVVYRKRLAIVRTLAFIASWRQLISEMGRPLPEEFARCSCPGQPGGWFWADAERAGQGPKGGNPSLCGHY
jgi:hypothetical protein